MKLQNISKKLLTGVVFTAALVSCSEDKMDEINKDHNHSSSRKDDPYGCHDFDCV